MHRDTRLRPGVTTGLGTSDEGCGHWAQGHKTLTCHMPPHYYLRSYLRSTLHNCSHTHTQHNQPCLRLGVIDTDCNLSREQLLSFCRDSLPPLNSQRKDSCDLFYNTVTKNKAVCKNIDITVHLGKVGSTDAAR